MPNALRFLFSGNDIQNVDVARLQVEDVAPGAAAGAPPAGSMRLRFRQINTDPVQVRPLLPGTIRFLVDPTDAGRLPDPETDSFTEADYAGWKTRGRLLVTAPKETVNEIAAASPELPVKPNRVWYGPVRLSPDFLFGTLTAGLKKGEVPAAGGGTIRNTNTDRWRKHAIAMFLAGRYTPVLATSNVAAQDDRVRFVMPTVEVPADGNIELFITTALAQKPQDAPDAAFDDPAAALDRDEPLHPRNGLIPAREVYRRLRANMVAEAATAAPLMAAMLSEWPTAPRFFPIRFTRTAELTANCSIHFPRQTVSIRSGPALLHEERLPAHGVVFLRQAPPPVGQPEPAPPSVQISLTGTMKWLLGGGTSWRDPGRTVPVEIDLAAVARPHIAVRLPMSEVMLLEPRPRGCGLCCSYMSLRRTVRALVDNRIAGGRLSFDPGTTSAVTSGLMSRAFEGTRARASIVANDLPRVADEADLANVESPKLIPVLEAFFPGDAQQSAFPGAPPNPIIFTRGRVLHDLWHTRWDEFQEPRQRANFPVNLIGRGGPGAAVGMGIASFHVDPTRRPGEADAAYFARVTNETLDGLRPGAVLQYWSANEDFEEIKAYAHNPAEAAAGHSPIFAAYIGPEGAHTGIEIIDQNGITRNGPARRTVGNPPFPLLLGSEQIWVSANWDE